MSTSDGRATGEHGPAAGGRSADRHDRETDDRLADRHGPATGGWPAGTRTISTTEAMEQFGRELADQLHAGDLLVLTGPLGAGKTTLTRGIGEGLGVRGPVTSPTFVLARTHPSQVGGPPLVHVDAYRLGSAIELDDLDIDFTGSVVVVEWGSGMLDGVADSWLDVAIERPTGGDTTAQAADDDEDAAPEEPRIVTVTPHGPRWG